MKSLLLFLLIFLISNILCAQNLNPVDLRALLTEQKGDKSLNNLLLFYTNDNELRRLNMIKSLKEQDFLDYAKDKYNILYVDARKYKNIAASYELHDCPLMVITAPDGRELNRMTNMVVRDLAADIDEKLLEGFTFPDREKKFKENPAYGAKYAYYLDIYKMPNAARRVLLEMLSQPIQKRFFITNGKRTILRLIRSLDDDILSLLELKRNEIIKVIGKDSYKELMSSIANSLIQENNRKLASQKIDINTFKTFLFKMNNDKVLASQSSLFLYENIVSLSSRDMNLVKPLLENKFMKLNEVSKWNILRDLSVYIPFKIQQDNRDFFISFFRNLSVKAKDEDFLKFLSKKIENLSSKK